MSAVGARALLYVTADPDGAPRVVAALERDARGASWFVPDPGRIATPDPRGRRTTLGALLGAHRAASLDDLVDVAAHLVPLPELDPDAEGPRPAPAPRLELRWVGVDGADLGRAWPAPGGGAFELHPAPLRLGPGRSGALLAARGAPGGPWLRALDPAVAEVRTSLELLSELGPPLVDATGPLDRWLERCADEREALAPVRAEVRAGFRELVRAALHEGAPPPLERDGFLLAVRTDPGPEHLRWRFELTGEGLEAATELESTRFAPDAVGDLLAVVDAPQQPYWLLSFETRPELGPVFAGVVDLRRYLAENLDLLEGGA